MTTQPVFSSGRTTALPDYYAEERRARKRVELRRSMRWVCLAVASAVTLLWLTGR